MSYAAIKAVNDVLKTAGYVVKWPGQEVPKTGAYVALNVISALPNNSYARELGNEIRLQVAYWKQTRSAREVLEADSAIATLLTPIYPRRSSAQILVDGDWMASVSDYIVIG